ncbi:hypothetical protein EYF80_008523 [Liparis tanakae]|uniref:Uncharacterized protein n=1 Tax=Liparis tanakae TaxID=230148 RepID=A0A4Z2IT57_9TELE|nr:hypothetical protein EYF80_008523 [Liparis tanakae]
MVALQERKGKVDKRNAGYPGSSEIGLSKMAARGTGFPPLGAMGCWDKEHHMRRFEYSIGGMSLSRLTPYHNHILSNKRLTSAQM